MQKHKLRSLMAGAATVGVTAVAATLVLGTGVASAAPADPPGGAVPVAPHFNNGNIEGIRDAGSDTTFFMMQTIGDLYTGAGLYGCTTNSSAGQTLYNSNDTSLTTNINYFCQANKNIDTTDVSDNWSRTEVTEGVDLVGSGGGQNQLCGATPTPLPVDFARSSKPAGTACGDMVETGYAKDGVPVIGYPVNPSNFGTSSIAPYNAVNGGAWGPVQQGWLPGDPAGGPYTGTPLSDMSNADGGGGTGSTAFRLWCATDATRITDWGALTNLGPTIAVVGVTTTSGSPNISVSGNFPSSVAPGQAVSGAGIPAGTHVQSVSAGNAVLTANATANSTNDTLDITTTTTYTEGNGVPVGISVRLLGVNTASGTEATFTSYVNSGASTGGCGSNMNTERGQRPEPGDRSEPQQRPHCAGEQLGPGHAVRQRGLPRSGLCRPGDRGVDHPVHGVQRRVQHEPVRR